GATAIPVELEEVLEDALDVIERVRPVLVARELDRLPDLLGTRIGSDLIELLLEAGGVSAPPRSPPEVPAAEPTEPPPQPPLGFALGQLRANRRRSRPSVGRSSARSTIASRWPNRKFDSASPKSSGSFSRVV